MGHGMALPRAAGTRGPRDGCTDSTWGTGSGEKASLVLNRLEPQTLQAVPGQRLSRRPRADWSKTDLSCMSSLLEATMKSLKFLFK